MKFWTDRTSGGSGRVDTGMISELRAYWEALREGDMLPRRDKVDPRGIASALEHSFLIERIAPGVARFRITGMVFNDLMGMDIRGMPLSCLFMGDARGRLQVDLEKVFQAPAVLTLDLLAERALGRPALRGRMQMLPMLNSTGASDLAIGCLELDGEIGRAPRRFSISLGHLERVVVAAPAPLTAPADGRRPATGPDAPRHGFAGQPPVAPPAAPAATVRRGPVLVTEGSHTGLSAPPRPARAEPGVPHLRLVKA